jgi:exosortase A-associated hydrolase 1
MMVEQRALHFECQSSQLIGILSLPVQDGPAWAPRGVLIVTGGPQYRVGSHRQFALLAHELAAAGMPAMRFDYRGMGDSEGEARTFEQIEQDLNAAIQHFFASVPDLKELVIWGLCDGATAAAYHCVNDQRICALILLNPWVRTEAGIARTTLRHYYIKRLLEPAFWRKLFSGRFKAGLAARSLRDLSCAAWQNGTAPDAGAPPQRMLDALLRFRGHILIILSGDDLTASEFLDLQRGSRQWRTLLAAPTVQQLTLARANHTCSRRIWRDEVARICTRWLASW